MNRKLIIALSLICLLALSFSMVQAQEDDANDDTLIVDAAWQPFENGVMVWFAGSNEIWVLIDNTTSYDTGDSSGTNNDGEGTVRFFSNSHDEGESNDKGDSGCNIDPIRGFGEVYFNNSLNGELGCPLADELGYDGTSNPGGSGIVQIDGPGNTSYEVNRDNNRWRTQTFF